MSEFSSFMELSRHFMVGGDFKILSGKGRAYRAALERTGEELVEYFQSKFDQGGPGWEAISPLTEEWRERYGYDPSAPPLTASGQLREAIGYEIENKHDLHIGVKEGYHEGPTGRTIDLGELMEIHENGYGHVPPRPVFGDAEAELRAAADRFAADVIAMGLGRIGSVSKRRRK